MGNDSDQCLSTLTGHSDGVMTVDWSPDGSQVVSGSGDKTAKIWDLASNKCITTFEGHTGTVMSAAWSHDGTQVATGSADNTVKIWDPKTGVFSASFTGHNDTVMSVAWSTGDRWMLSSGGNTVLIWDPVFAACLATFNVQDAFGAAWSPDAKQIVSASCVDSGKIWDPIKNQCIWNLQDAHVFPAWSCDGSRVAALSSVTGNIEVWDVNSGQAIASLPAGDNYYDHNAVWSPDGKQVASPTTLETVTVLDIATQETVITLQGHSDWVRWLAWDYKGENSQQHRMIIRLRSGV
ncbi:hypothetical protein TrVFT333_000157 [Trichoderma virens FT-333]|nr:hypothetical protein TrVFT333_000157 [Trichoderma virens FT-333]